jgi:NhaP-type Na+/H+ or K+/H+ antiporter
VDALPPVQSWHSTLFVAAVLVFIAGGMTLFRLSRRLSQQSGRYALLDVIASLYAVGLLFWLLAVSGEQLAMLSGILFAITCGICSSAFFRIKSKDRGLQREALPASRPRETL